MVTEVTPLVYNVKLSLFSAAKSITTIILKGIVGGTHPPYIPILGIWNPHLEPLP